MKRLDTVLPRIFVEREPIGRWFRDQRVAEQRVASGDTKQLTVEELRKRLVPYHSELVLPTTETASFKASEGVDNGGTEALRALVAAEFYATPNSQPWLILVDESWSRGLAHLRNVGLAHRVEHGRVTLLGEGPHPFAKFVRRLARRRVGVVFAPFETTCRSRGSVSRELGRVDVVLGIEALLELDPEGVVLAHERVHLGTPENIGRSPFAGHFELRSLVDGRFPGFVVWGYPNYQKADECHAHCRNVEVQLRRIACDLCSGYDRAGARNALRDVRFEIGDALQVTLRTIAVDKRTLGAIEDNALRRHRTQALFCEHNHTFVVERGKSFFAVRFRSRFMLPFLEAIDSALPSVRGMSWLSRAYLRRHFVWQLRAAHERLALLRVTAQSVERAMDDHCDDSTAAALCEAAADLLGRTQISHFARSRGITYDEALAILNVSMRPKTFGEPDRGLLASS